MCRATERQQPLQDGSFPNPTTDWIKPAGRECHPAFIERYRTPTIRVHESLLRRSAIHGNCDFFYTVAGMG
jgi:hypothetical protein